MPPSPTEEQRQPLLALEEEMSPMAPYEKDRPISRAILVQTDKILLQVKTFRPSRAYRLLRQFGYVFVPTIVRSKFFGERSPPPRLHATSWLDGLRGLGCVVVFNTHFLFAFNDAPVRSWGVDAKHNSIAELPLIRWLYSSGLGIMIFFLVAGFVCSLKPLRLMRNNDSASRDKLLQALSLSTFKRFFRLYLPVITSTFLVAILAYLGVFEWSRPFIGDKKYFPGVSKEPQITRYPTLSKQLGFWLEELNEMMSVWEFKPFYPIHDHHLWSIREQYRGSMYLYAGLVALARTRESWRVVFIILLDLYLLWWGRWEIALFFCGSLIAQFEVIRQGNQAASNNPSEKSEKANDPTIHLPAPVSQAVSRFEWRQLRLLGNIAWTLAFMLAFYFMSAPRFAYRQAPGYEFLTKNIPKWYLHKETLLPSIGATVLMYCLSLCGPSTFCYKVLTRNTVQYLGKVSFSLYLVHGPMLHIVGYMFPHAIWHFIGNETTATYAFGLLIGWAMNLAMVLWAADVYTREVDKRIVHLVGWIEKICIVKA